VYEARYLHAIPQLREGSGALIVSADELELAAIGSDREILIIVEIAVKAATALGTLLLRASFVCLPGPLNILGAAKVLLNEVERDGVFAIRSGSARSVLDVVRAIPIRVLDGETHFECLDIDTARIMRRRATSVVLPASIVGKAGLEFRFDDGFGLIGIVCNLVVRVECQRFPYTGGRPFSDTIEELDSIQYPSIFGRADRRLAGRALFHGRGGNSQYWNANRRKDKYELVKREHCQSYK